MNTRIFCSLMVAMSLAACGGGGDDSPMRCGSESAARTQIASGVGAELLTHGVDLATSTADRTVAIDFAAERLLESRSGVALGPRGAVASYRFIRLYRNGEFWQNLPDTSVDESSLPVAEDACLAITQRATASVSVPAGDSVRVEAVWSIVRPQDGEDLTAITEYISLTAR